MKSAHNYPTCPFTHGEYLPDILLDSAQWNTDNFLMYDSSGFMPALVQFIHRNLAYIILGLVMLMAFNLKGDRLRWMGLLLVGIIVVQVVLGILTLVNSLGSIPVFYGVLHQAVGILFITSLFYIKLITKPGTD